MFGIKDTLIRIYQMRQATIKTEAATLNCCRSGGKFNLKLRTYYVPNLFNLDLNEQDKKCTEAF